MGKASKARRRENRAALHNQDGATLNSPATSPAFNPADSPADSTQAKIPGNFAEVTPATESEFRKRFDSKVDDDDEQQSEEVSKPEAKILQPAPVQDAPQKPVVAPKRDRTHRNQRWWRIRPCKWWPCLTIRWLWLFVSVLPNALLRLAWHDVFYMLVVFLAVFYALKGVAEFQFRMFRGVYAQENDGCSIVYVTLPGPIITVSLIEGPQTSRTSVIISTDPALVSSTISSPLPPASSLSIRPPPIVDTTRSISQPSLPSTVPTSSNVPSTPGPPTSPSSASSDIGQPIPPSNFADSNVDDKLDYLDYTSSLWAFIDATTNPRYSSFTTGDECVAIFLDASLNIIFDPFFYHQLINANHSQTYRHN
ncbi:hypothetical protein EJ04DRAFT_563402 [Polyplosphaeria fusca]|uniref:Uncharacterized protein n=1 Tax=Polyplosphaeria fusca TaxID=682080 RepID=A0A9P4R223_9PLEO|nr:hypothetical protein EJ04DRAFT_563402 [Polyplosphaeria fusca]